MLTFVVSIDHGCCAVFLCAVIVVAVAVIVRTIIFGKE